jgi:signal transduction histidine kinase
MRSVRRRVVAGAFIWSLGLFFAVTVLLTFSPPVWRTVRMVHEHHVLAAVLGTGCMIGGLIMLRSAFVPFDQMRRRLSDVQRGADRQLHGSYPVEVQPLVDDLNSLLVHNQEALARATAKAGDLAHGLKTPLAVLSNEADRLAARGQAELSDIVAQQVAMMRRQVDYHLAHARAAASGAALGTRCLVKDSADGLVRTLERLHADRGIAIEVDVPPDHGVRMERQDLDEMLGNLLDNACKWAKSRVTVASSAHHSLVVITVDDDGPGLASSMHETVLQRGVRADQAAPGSGLGLAIVRELAELHGGTIHLERSPDGGLRARLQLPAA